MDSIRSSPNWSDQPDAEHEHDHADDADQDVEDEVPHLARAERHQVEEDVETDVLLVLDRQSSPQVCDPDQEVPRDLFGP